MPNDLVSREAAAATAIEAIVDTYIGRQWTSSDDFRFMATKAVAVAIANLPAAGDERWEKEIRSLIDDYRASLNQGVLESDTGEDMLHHVTEDLERIRDRLSPPQQEAGDEPGK